MQKTMAMMAEVHLTAPKGKEQQFHDACLLFEVAMMSEEEKELLRRLIKEGEHKCRGHY